MAVPVQAGTDLEIGFKSFSWTGYIPEDGMTWKKGYKRTEEHMDTNGATRTKIRMDEYESVSATFVIDLAQTPYAVVLTDGDVITVTPPGGTSSTWEVEEASTALAAGAIKLTATLIKEVSMSYT
jgi:hypothetical protein